MPWGQMWLLNLRRIVNCVKQQYPVEWEQYPNENSTLPKHASTLILHYETLRKLRHALQNKRRSMLQQVIVRIHDNARSHSAIMTDFHLEQFHPLLPVQPWSSSKRDYHIFQHLKLFLLGKQFKEDKVWTLLPHGWNRRRLHSTTRVHKSSCPAMINASTMVLTMLENNLNMVIHYEVKVFFK